MATKFQPLSIEQFLPAYSGINVEKNNPFYSFYSSKIPPGVDKEFYPSTFLKKEFNDLKLKPVEFKKPGEPFKPLSHQSFMARFLSQHTPYDKMLIFHEVGSGKSCLASLLSETSQADNPNLSETIFLVKNDVLQRNISEEIATVCTNNKYLPTPLDPKKPLTPKQYIRKLNRNIGENYLMYTFERFAKELAANDLAYIKELYSNRIIIIDEAHNLRAQPRDTTVSIYKQIFRFLHTVVNCKIILMTATPMRDRPVEIARLLNLLLPDDPEHQFQADTFMRDYFDGVVFKDSMRAQFKSRIRGLVSFVRAMSSDVKQIYKGSVITSYLGDPSRGMKKMPLVAAKMSPNQSKAYEEAYRKDRKNNADLEEVDELEEEEIEAEPGRAGVYNNSRSAAMFVAPDGTYGDDVTSTWVIISKEEEERRAAIRKAKETKALKKAQPVEEEKVSKKKGAKGPRIVRPLGDRLTRVSEALKDYIYSGQVNPSDEEKLAKLGTLSAKWAGVIRELILNPTEKAFIYSNLVIGSGTNLFAAILELFGFQHVALPEPNEGEDFKLEKYAGKKKFVLITGNFPTSRQANFLINKVYNNPANLYGDYIQVIVASKIVGEGSSFKHTRQFHNLTPGWNETETSQAQGRAIRAFSHDQFPTPEEKYIKIFRWAAMPSKTTFPSIDFEMYKLSEDKDYPIKQVERLLKEIAVDCALNAARNMRPDLDQENSRQCDYSTCVYQCQDIPASWYLDKNSKQIPGLIEDSYNLYYAQGQIEEIKQVILGLFQVRFVYDFFELVQLLPEATELILIRALKEIIDQSLPITNRYGITAYLQESQNLYFLVDNHEVRNAHNLYLLALYNIMPVIKEEMSFKDYVSYFEYLYLGDKLDKLAALDIGRTPLNDLSRSFHSFDLPIQERLLEAFVIAEQRGLARNQALRKAFLEIYKNSLELRPDGLFVSSLLLEDHNILRCYDPGQEVWTDCSQELIQSFGRERTEREASLKRNPYGYYGTFKGGKFKIITVRDARITEKGKIDKRGLREGNVCGTGFFSKTKIMGMLIHFGQIAESLGAPAPTVIPFLSESNRQGLEEEATPENTFEELEKARENARAMQEASVRSAKEKKEKRKKKKQEDSKEEPIEEIIPSLSLEDIAAFSPEKRTRIYAILKKASAKNLCDALASWFESQGLIDPK